MARLENDKWAGAQIAQSGRDVHLYVDGKLVEKIKDELSGAIWIKPDATGCEVVLRAKDTKVIDGVSVHDSALSAEDIHAIFEKGKE